MIKFTETFPQFINFGNGFRTGFTQRSVIWSAYFDAWNAVGVIHGPAWITTVTPEELLYTFTSPAVGGNPEGHLAITARWTTVSGIWRTNSAYKTVGQWYRFGYSYDAGSTANDPVIYVNGVSVALTETGTPSGSYPAGGTNQNFGIGGWGGNTINGKMDAPLLYNRILTADEFLRDYRSFKRREIMSGLQFAPILDGCKGRQSFNNITLTADDLFIDPVSRAQGVPSNFISPTTGAFPVGVGSDSLMIGEMA